MALRSKISRSSVRRSGSGGIDQLTSVDGSVTLNPASGDGPVVDLSTAGDVTKIVAGTNITISPPGGTGVVTINAGSSAASWPLANPRVYAVDGTNGNDANAGFADAAGPSAAQYRAACAAAGLVAKKTIAGLSAILPAIGAGRMVVILIAADTYTDDLGTALNGIEGYASGCPLVRGTITDATAGSVAFSGSNADEVMAGGVTATGMFAAGYNPAAATVQQLVLTKVGGGNPGFAAEGAVPLGWRVRFDAATTTVALRGLTRQVARVSGTDTINLQTVLPISPLNTDVCYLEMAGVVIPAFNFAGPPNGQLGAQFVGLRSSGTWGLQFADGHFTFCGANAFVAQQQTDNQVVTDQSFTNPILGVLMPGGGFRSETTAEINRGGATLAGLVSATSTTLRTMQDLAWGAGSAARNLAVLSCRLGSSTDSTLIPNIGSPTNAAGIPHTFGSDANGGVFFDGSDAILGNLIVIGAGANPCIKVAGICHLAFAFNVDGTTGNNDVGLDLTRSAGSEIAISFALTPTVTGTVGDIRWEGGALDAWASLGIQEQYDPAGNHLFLTGTNFATKAITPSVANMTNVSGAGITGQYLLIKQTGASNQFKVASAGDTPDGIMGTPNPPNGGTAIAGALSGYRVVQFDGAPTLGAPVFVSPANTGAATTTDPGGQQPLGVVVDVTLAGNRAVVHFGSAVLPVFNATWALPVSSAVPNVRFYALDGVAGVDTNPGFSDVSAADAGTKAVRTAARLNQILPIDGQGRNVVILVNSFNYAEASSFLMGRVGYAYFLARGTVTDATAGSTAFLDDANDRNMNGNITATGMNAAGYNPTGAPTTRAIQCLKVGGAAPGFPAEVPISFPGGARIRFDINTTTAALRGVRRTVVKVAGTDTLSVDTLLPAAPVAADIFYLEMPGARFTELRANLFNGPALGGVSVLSGLQSNGTVSGARGINIAGTVQLADCYFSGAQASSLRGGTISLNSAYTTATNTTQDTGGACRSAGRYSVTGAAQFLIGVGTGPYCGSFSIGRSGTGEPQTSFVAVTGVAYALVHGTAQNSAEGDPDCIGTNASQTAAGYGPCRILGPGTFNVACGLYLAASATVAALDITGMGAVPAIVLLATGERLTITGPLTGSTGNTDVGLDLTNAQGCFIYLDSLPTVTGTAGDIRTAGGQIITWAQAQAGFVDSKGNRFAGTSAPLGVIKFSGSILGAAGATVSYLDDGGPGLAANQTTPIRYPTSQRLMMRLRVNSISNSSVNAVTCTLYKNGVATAMQVSIPAGSAANTKFVDSAHPILFADGDDFDLRLDDGAVDATHVVNVSALLEYAM